MQLLKAFTSLYSQDLSYCLKICLCKFLRKFETMVYREEKLKRNICLSILRAQHVAMEKLSGTNAYICSHSFSFCSFIQWKIQKVTCTNICFYITCSAQHIHKIYTHKHTSSSPTHLTYLTSSCQI